MCGTFVPPELESAFYFLRQYFNFEEKSLYRSCKQGLQYNVATVYKLKAQKVQPLDTLLPNATVEPL